MATSITEARDPAKVWHFVQARLEALGTGGVPAPVSIEIQPTMSCNLRCKWCSYWQRNNFTAGRPEFMPYHIVQGLSEYCSAANVKSVYVSGGGEPCAYPRIADLISEFSQGPCQIALITNGTLFEKRLLHLAHRITYVQVSLIQPDRASYQQVAGEDLHGRMAALPTLIKSRCGNRSPTVGAMYVISEWNYEGASRAAHFAHESGFDYCAFRWAVDFERRGLEVSNAARQSVAAQLNDLRDLDSTFTNLAAIANSAGGSSEPASLECVQVSLGLYIIVNPLGDVYLCVPDVGKKEFAIGNLHDLELSEIWGSAKHLQIAADLHSRYRRSSCHEACRAHGYNRAVAAGIPEILPEQHLAFL